MISFFLPLLFFLSLFGVGYVVIRKIPELVAIPHESLEHQETFFAFLKRAIMRTIVILNPRRILIRLLSYIARILNVFRIFFLKVYRFTETLTHTAREKSQRMDWEHHWYSPGDTKQGDDEEKSG